MKTIRHTLYSVKPYKLVDAKWKDINESSKATENIQTKSQKIDPTQSAVSLDVKNAQKINISLYATQLNSKSYKRTQLRKATFKHGYTEIKHYKQTKTISLPDKL